jgi:asparagine N-glycosylation enzyme membrane subunit Stt3
MFGLLLTAIIAFFSMFIPGVLLAFALLNNTELNKFEIIVIGFIFGLIAPATLTWLESYLIPYVHAFTFSLGLFELNALILTIIGAALCFREHLFDNLGSKLAGLNKKPEEHHQEHQEHHHITKQKASWWIWAILLILMLVTFYTRLQSIVTAPKFFEFDPYFDMIDAHYILTYGKQLLLDPSAWPVVAAGTNHRLQPLVPYLEAFWYSLANSLQYHHIMFSTTLMSYVGSIYPPIVAALLVFVIFMILYHEYDGRIGLIGAGLTAMMPVLFTTFIAGEQLVEPFGIFALFFFIGTYMLAIRNMKSKKLAVLAGIAFASNFLTAHYYTVTVGVMLVYILIQGIIDVLRNESLTDFYKMNAIVIVVMLISYALYAPYQATLQSNLSSAIIAGPALALILIAVLDYVPKALAKRKILIKENTFTTKLLFLVIVAIIVLLSIFFTPLGKPIENYLNISTRFTTPSKPLFMTVQEYIPTGALYSFGSQGFGAIGAGLLNIPYLVWLICIIAVGFIMLSIAFRHSKTGILFIAIALPLMAAGFSEVKYLPHFGVAYIILFCIILGELLYFASSNFYKTSGNDSRRWTIISLSFMLGVITLLMTFSLLYNIILTAALLVVFAVLFIVILYLTQHKHEISHSIANVYHEHSLMSQCVLIIGLFFIFGLMLALGAIIFILIYRYGIKQSKDNNNIKLIVLCIVLAAFSLTSSFFFYGEFGSLLQSFSAQVIYLSNPSNACTLISNAGNSLGYNLYCNTIPPYWLASMSWINANVGPNAPRVLAWWDYGDWINWFGNSNAVLRGDNSVAAEDYAVAAQYVLGPKYNATPQTLESYMNKNQTKYVLFDQDLISKWGALDFLGCVNVNATSQAYAIAQGKAQTPPVPYLLGSSQCELSHDPEYALIPLSALAPGAASGLNASINNFCQISSGTTTFIRGYLVIGNNVENNTICVDSTPNANGVLSVYSSDGTKTNSVIQEAEYLGVQSIQGTPYVQFLMIYLPNAPNDSITNAPSQFYTSNFYKGFFLGNLPGFKEVYPTNVTAGGVNFVNGTYPVRIYEIVNYTGGLPPVPPKPSYIHNNDTMP